MTALVASVVFATAMSAAADKRVMLRAWGQAESRPSQSAQSDADAIRQRVKEGQKVRITDDQGREWRGRIGTFTPDKLTLITSDRQQRDVPYGTILRIDRPHDGLGNGALIGLGTGAAVGLLAVISEESNCEPTEFFGCGDPIGAAYIAAPLVIGGLGAAIGVGIDALIKKDPTLFRRSGASRVTLAPTIARGVRGVTVSMRW
jgi:hypothetical protein